MKFVFFRFLRKEREFIRTKHAGNQKGLYPSMLVPIIQLIVVNSIQTYKKIKIKIKKEKMDTVMKGLMGQCPQNFLG